MRPPPFWQQEAGESVTANLLSSLMIVFSVLLHFKALTLAHLRHKEIYIFKEKHHSRVKSKFPLVISKCRAVSAVKLNMPGRPHFHPLDLRRQ